MAHPDWNGKLHVPNGSPLSKPYPKDREFWAVTADETVVLLAYWPEASWWSRADVFSSPEEDGKSYDADELMGWADSYEDAEEAAMLLGEAA